MESAGGSVTSMSLSAEAADATAGVAVVVVLKNDIGGAESARWFLGLWTESVDVVWSSRSVLCFVGGLA